MRWSGESREKAGSQPNPSNPTKCQVVVWAAAFEEGSHECVDLQVRNIVAGSYSRGEREEKRGKEGRE